MPEEERQPTVGQVATDKDGTPQVSDEELLGALGVNLDDDQQSAPTATPETKPEAAPPPAGTPPPQEPGQQQKRKIKWQGQEVEVDPDKEVELIQKGFDYTQKMQQLAAERDLLTPHVGVLKAIQQDPALQRKIAEHLTGRPAESQREEKAPQFDDPIEQLKWEIRQEVLKEVEEKHVKPIQAQTQQMTHQQMLSSVRSQVQSDPLFPEVQQAIAANVQAIAQTMGPEIAGNMYRQLDQDPNVYLKAYHSMRPIIAARKQGNSQTQPPPASNPNAANLPEPTKREERAPILESANSAPTESEARESNEKLKSLNKRARAGDYRALGELLLKGGMMKGIIE